MTMRRTAGRGPSWKTVVPRSATVGLPSVTGGHPLLIDGHPRLTGEHGPSPALEIHDCPPHPPSGRGLQAAQLHSRTTNGNNHQCLPVCRLTLIRSCTVIINSRVNVGKIAKNIEKEN